MRRFLCVCLFLLLPAAAYSQEATLSGTVTDATGAVLPGVTVRAVHEASGNVFAIAESWHRGPTAEPVDDPTQIDALARKLLADARPNADMQGRDRKE